MQINAKLDTEKLSRKLNSLQKKQLPFAAAKAFTDTLKNNVKPAAIAEAKKTFKIKTGWILKGIRIIPANKNKFPNFRSGIGTKDEVVRQNALGEKRESQINKPFIGDKLAVPTSYARRKFGRRLSYPSMWAGNLLSKQTKRLRYFVEQQNGEDVSISMVQGKQVYRIYTLKNKLEIPKRFRFERISYAVFKRNIGPNFKAAMAHALRSAR